MIKRFEQLIIATDIEAGGTIPGMHSLYSIGAAAFSISTGKPEIVDRFEINLSDMVGTTTEPVTDKFWKQFPEAYQYARKNQVKPTVAMEKFDNWVRNLPRQGIFTAWPASFDFSFIAYYYFIFLRNRKTPFIGPPLDMRAYGFAADELVDWGQYKIANLPPEILPHNPRPHHAIDDAIAQGYAACNIILKNIS